MQIFVYFLSFFRTKVKHRDNDKEISDEKNQMLILYCCVTAHKVSKIDEDYDALLFQAPIRKVWC